MLLMFEERKKSKWREGYDEGTLQFPWTGNLVKVEGNMKKEGFVMILKENLKQ